MITDLRLHALVLRLLRRAPERRRGPAAVGTVSTGPSLVLDGPGRPGGGGSGPSDAHGQRPRPGIGLYYAVLAFDPPVTAWLGEWLLPLIGVALHAAPAAGPRVLLQQPAVRPGLQEQHA